MLLVIFWQEVMRVMLTTWTLATMRVVPLTSPRSAPGVVDVVGAAELVGRAEVPTGKIFDFDSVNLL
jgi:hypothetical protein